MDDMGIFELAPNGTVFSFDRNGTVIDTKQLDGTEFKTLTGCNMVTPGMPPSAVSETDQCLQKDNITIPGNSNDVSRKRDGELFERDFVCGLFICTTSADCFRIGAEFRINCLGCLGNIGRPNVCIPI